MFSNNPLTKKHMCVALSAIGLLFFCTYILPGKFISVSKLLSNIKNFAAVIDMSGTQLLSTKTFVKDSANFTAPQLSPKLWDGCTVGTPECTANAPDTASFFVEFDFGAIYDLQSARIFGDADGTGISESWTLEYKKESSHTWANAFSAKEALGNGWFEEALTNVAARYIRVTVSSNRVSASATQAREIEVYGTLAIASTPVSASSTPTVSPSTPAVAPPTSIISTGTTYIVSPQGNDINAGTLEAPWKTAQKAADTARAGDTILFREGMYRDGFTARYSGTKDAVITFRNFPGERPLFDFGVTNALSATKRIELQAVTNKASPISWIVIEGLEIKNAHEGIRFYNATDVVIKNNTMHDTFYSGIEGIGGLRVTIDSNRVYRIGLKDLANKTNDDKNHGMHLTGSDYRISNNVIYDVRAYGIYLAGYPFSNLKYTNEQYSRVRNALLANNVIAYSRFRAGVALWEDTTNSKIVNNIFYLNALNLSTGDTAGIDFIYAGAGHSIRNNIFYHSSKLDASPGSSGLSTSEKNFSADPKFSNASAYNFSLQATSPAIDTGIAVSGISIDFIGNSRPQGCCLDVGAYEYTVVDRAPSPAVPAAPELPIVSTLPIAPSPVASPTPGAFSIGSYVKVSSGETVRVRKTPSLQGTILGREKPNAVGVIGALPIQADGHTWYKIKFQADMIEGWTSGQYLVSLSPTSNFAINASVQTKEKVNIRSTAGGVKIGEQAGSSIGSVLGGPIYQPYRQTNWWWKIDFKSNPDGWVSGDYITSK
ncbi:MAG: parallel beta-helix repeat-containing protein [Parcubacteria group bacterium Greene0714_4]|nr:MAG: parallel beta-helix repeat-containing protein [Parcubacteria group bacterium Greene1014_15]TSD08134.1 MAG: parallel beta-helix repeat-containing protein [Parcubacteria group bacterium Greene0714_4]